MSVLAMIYNQILNLTIYIKNWTSDLGSKQKSRLFWKQNNLFLVHPFGQWIDRCPRVGRPVLKLNVNKT